MYDKRTLKTVLFLIVMTMINAFVFVAELLLMPHGSVRTLSLIFTGFDVLLFSALIYIAAKEDEEDRSDGGE